MKKSIKQHGFSFLELMVVIIVIGIMTAFAVPNYEHMRDRSREKNMANNLSLIHQAIELYKARTGSSIGPLDGTDPIDLQQMNTLLHLNIVADKDVDYECGNGPDTDVNSVGYVCWAESHLNNDPPDFMLYIDYDLFGPSDMIPVCCVDKDGSGGDCNSGYDPCPSCDTSGCPWDK